ncbi:MAG: ORC1-type DNA replication protein [Candidatus Aenigmatarchaeota archaeon]|nr:MAG: ORC1-type DNA replication protein [Candidatus Aenigmarchaeota archaeon]
MQTQVSLDDIFSNYTNGVGVFKNKDTLSADFTPANIPHRQAQIEQLAHMMAPALRGEKPSNIFIYGKTGTGKSLCINKVTDGLESAAEKGGKGVKIIYLNCKMRNIADTEYRLLAQIISFFGESVPFTGLPTNTLYHKLFGILDKNGGNVILVLDEIDALLDKMGDDILYNITRINQEIEKTKITMIGISNKPTFIDNLDPRIKSSLSEEEMVFPPYDAREIKDILEERTKTAFNEGTIEYAAITKCAALAAQENGDARKALDLLRVAAELCEREGGKRVTERHVNMAQEKLDKDRIIEIIRAQPKQSKMVLLAMLQLYRKERKAVQTGDVYTLYDRIAMENGLKSLTQRRVSDLISELDMLGVINASVISKGRYGRTRKINIQLNEKLVSVMSKTLGGEFPEAFINF